MRSDMGEGGARRAQAKKYFAWRKAMQFTRFEKIASIAMVLLMIAGLSIYISRQLAADNLIRGGQCSIATITDSSHLDSRRYGTRVTIAYTQDGLSYSETMHYEGNRLVVGSKITLCVGSEDPKHFATKVGGLLGTSTNLWLRMVIGGWVTAIGFVVLVILMSAHQWRFRKDE